MARVSANDPIYRILVATEILAVASAGVFGNLIANLISMSPTWILFGSVATILFCFFATIQRLQYENNKENYSFSLNIKFGKLPDEIIKREAFVFPIALLSGILIGFVYTALFPKEDMFILQTRWFGEYRYLSWHDYEVFSYPLAVVIIYAFNRYTKDVVLVFIFSVGYTIGLLGTFMLYRPERNDFINMLINFSVIMVFTAIVRSRVIGVFFDDVRSIWNRLTEK